MLNIWSGAWTYRTRLADGRYRVKAKSGKKRMKTTDMTAAWAARVVLTGILKLPPLDEEPLVGTGPVTTMVGLGVEAAVPVAADDPVPLALVPPGDVAWINGLEELPPVPC